MNHDLDALRSQLGQLKELHASGVIAEESFREASRELERRIVDAVMAARTAAAPAASPAPARAAAARPWHARPVIWLAALALAGGAAALPHAWSAATGEAAREAASGGLTLEAISSQLSSVSSVGGRVTISPKLLAQASPEDAVFVFARSTDGSRMPLAAMRRQVKDLPFEFRLDDSMAMAPEATLSSASTVVVTARVSRSGDATASAGDLFGSSVPVAVGSAGLAVEINDVVAK